MSLKLIYEIFIGENEGEKLFFLCLENSGGSKFLCQSHRPP